MSQLYFYSPSTKGFYLEEIHGKNIPDDVLKVPEDKYPALFAAVNNGYAVVNNNGFAEAGAAPAPYQPPPVTAEQVRAQRDQLIAATDWSQFNDQSLSTRDKWRPYRQALRDVTAQAGFPDAVKWPAMPVDAPAAAE